MTISVGFTLFLGNSGSKIGAIDGAIGAGISVASENDVGTITGTIQPVASVAGLLPGPVGGLANAIAVGVTVGKVGGTDKITWGYVLGVIGGVGGIVAVTAAAPGVIALGAFISVAAGTASLTYTISTLPSWSSKAISPTLGTAPGPLVKTIKFIPFSDPLVLDLDGDGLEITPLSGGVLFDSNNDAIRTGSAWAGADDGMVVWDRNGNGLIDSKRALFAIAILCNRHGRKKRICKHLEPTLISSKLWFRVRTITTVNANKMNEIFEC